jgi:hypothetical protein
MNRDVKALADSGNTFNHRGQLFAHQSDPSQPILRRAQFQAWVDSSRSKGSTTSHLRPILQRWPSPKFGSHGLTLKHKIDYIQRPGRVQVLEVQSSMKVDAPGKSD